MADLTVAELAEASAIPDAPARERLVSGFRNALLSSHHPALVVILSVEHPIGRRSPVPKVALTIANRGILVTLFALPL
jgi:hypothetical protein